MRKYILTVVTSLLSCATASAFWPEAVCSNVEVGVGYRQDSIKLHSKCHQHESCGCEEYSGSGYNYLLDGSSNGYNDGSGYDGYSGDRFKNELSWKDLNIWEIEIRGKYITCDNVYVRGSADYGWITSGKKHEHFNFERFDQNTFAFAENDGYFNGNNSFNHKDVSGYVYDIKLAVGYQFKLCDDSFAITPLIGYAWQGQQIKGKRNNNDYGCEEEIVAYGGNDYGNSGYSGSGRGHREHNLRWNGFFIGFDFDYSFCCEWDLFGTYEYHWADYHSKFGLNNCESRFHQHCSNAWGQVFDIGVRWAFCDCWIGSLRGEFQWFEADKARAHWDVWEGGGECTRANLVLSKHASVRWDSAAVILDLGMDF